MAKCEDHTDEFYVKWDYQSLLSRLFGLDWTHGLIL